MCCTLLAVCEVNEYIHPTSGMCAACPTDSTSAGGTPSMCTCSAGTGRVNEADVTLPCLGECQSRASDQQWFHMKPLLIRWGLLH